jgi:hypothetical protein
MRAWRNGRRAGLRNQSFKGCGFKSLRSYQTLSSASRHQASCARWEGIGLTHRHDRVRSTEDAPVRAFVDQQQIAAVTWRSSRGSTCRTHQQGTLVRPVRASPDKRVAAGSIPAACTSLRSLRELRLGRPFTFNGLCDMQERAGSIRLGNTTLRSRLRDGQLRAANDNMGTAS